MADRVRKILFRDKDIPLYFTALLGVLAFIYYPTFFNAPRSDWWETLYFFHTIYASPLPFQWLNILNTDCILHVSFRPLSHLVLYLQHSLFGANFFCIHLINFFLYFLSLVLLYKLATAFVSQKLLVFIAVVFFSLLYSHFDIVSWTAHSYLILGFCLLLLGFLFYIRFLNTGLKRMLFLTVFLLLSGMLCYEAFIFWPLAVVFLAYTGSLIKGRQLTNARAGLSWILVIAVTYFFYILIFLLTRSINTYADSGAQTHTLIFQLVSIPRIYRTVLAVFFDILYNGILVNIVPLFAYPPRISFPSFNLLLGGFLSSHRPAIIDMQILSGILLLIICWFIVYLSRRRKFDIIKSFLFFFFLLLTFSGTVFISKYYTNREYAYSLFQFRYHFVPSALIMLIASLFFERLGKLNKKIKAILCIILVLITALNVYCITSSILLESRQMATLNDMIVNIKRGISSKQINEKDRVYLDNRMVNILPKMCWNPIIGRFMKGTYQWMFNKKEIKYFSNSPESATWFINPRDFNLTKQLPQGIFGESNKVGLNEDIQVISFIQCEDYIDLGNAYYEEGRLDQAEKIFIKVLRINPENDNAYVTLGDIYRSRGNYAKAKKMFQRAIEINPENENGYISLAGLYQLLGEYAQAARMYKHSLKINPVNANVYDGLGTLRANQQKYQEAERMYRKALKLNPDNAVFYDGLGSSCKRQGKYSQAEQMYKEAIRLDPDNDIFYVNLGIFYGSQDRYTEAAGMFKQALKLNPKNIEAYNALEDCDKR